MKISDIEVHQITPEYEDWIAYQTEPLFGSRWAHCVCGAYR